MTNFEAVEILLKAAHYIPEDFDGYAEALTRAVWALGMAEVRSRDAGL